MNPEFKTLDQMIRRVVKKYNSFIICPFGDCGMKTKEILNKRYGIQETAILDNGLADYNPQIFKVNRLCEMDTRGAVILLNTMDREINNLLFRQIREIDAEVSIANVQDELIVWDCPEKARWFRRLKQLLSVKEVKGIPLVRIGRDYDGGYIMPDDFNSTLRAYSFGISNDVSWDKDIASRGIEVFMYDPTIPCLPEENSHFHFYKKGISGKDLPEEDLFSMETILDWNGDSNNRNLILKMDVEGAEWEFLEDVSSEVLGQFIQMTFEWHDVVNIPGTLLRKIIEKINCTHQVVWLHGNNCAAAVRGGEILMPFALEITFVRKEDYEFTKSESVYPLSIDMPNNPNKPDHILGNWG